MTEPRSGFVPGLLTGLAIAGVAVQIWLAVFLSDIQSMYVEFGYVPTGISKLVTSPLWRWSVPTLAVFAIVALIARRPRRLGPYVATAVLLAVTVATTWHFAQAPLYQLSDIIKN